MRDPRYRTIFQSDYSWLEEDDKGDAYLEIAQEDEDGKKFYVYRFDLEQLERLKVGGKVLYVLKSIADSYRKGKLPYPVETYREWYLRDLKSVASSADTTVRDLLDDLCSDDPRERSRAYEDIGGHYGFDNFDSYPLVMGYKEFEHYWSNEAGEPEPEEEE